LGGAAPASQAERERTRGLILEGLMTSHRMTTAVTIPTRRTPGPTTLPGTSRPSPRARERGHTASAGRGDAARKAGLAGPPTAGEADYIGGKHELR
jgi:hypothetical protein